MRIPITNIEKYGCKCPESNGDFLHICINFNQKPEKQLNKKAFKYRGNF